MLKVCAVLVSPCSSSWTYSLLCCINHYAGQGTPSLTVDCIIEIQCPSIYMASSIENGWEPSAISPLLCRLRLSCILTHCVGLKIQIKSNHSKFQIIDLIYSPGSGFPLLEQRPLDFNYPGQRT